MANAMTNPGNFKPGSGEPDTSAKRGLPKLRLDFEGRMGEYFRRIKDSPEDDYSEMVKGPKNKLVPSGRRWIQLLTQEKNVASSSRNILTCALNTDNLIKKHKCVLTAFSDPFAENISFKPEQINFLKEAAEKADREGRKIDGFSFFNKEERRIFYRNEISKWQQRFVVIHELSHFLLGHNREVFCKISNDDDPLETSKYHEEADKFAAIMLMPHRYIKKNMKKDNKEIAKILQVPEKAVEKRKEEVENEIYVLLYR